MRADTAHGNKVGHECPWDYKNPYGNKFSNRSVTRLEYLLSVSMRGRGGHIIAFFEAHAGKIRYFNNHCQFFSSNDLSFAEKKRGTC